jgi:hypothetical protein
MRTTLVALATHPSQGTIGMRAGALAVGFVVLASVLAPTALADWTNDVVCQADSAALGEREPGTGCAESWIDTWVECGVANATWECEVWATMGIDVGGLATSALTAADDAPLNVTENATACHALADQRSLARDTYTERMTTYTDDEIPGEGRTAVVNVTACVRPAGDEASRSCDTYHHTEHVPAKPWGGTTLGLVANPKPSPLPPKSSWGGTTLGLVEDLAEGQADYALTTANHATAPASVHP